MDQLTYVFIAGPYAGTTHDYRSFLEIDDNIAKARRAAVSLVRAGIPFYSAHLNCAHFEVVAHGMPDEFWYELDNVFLRNASMVYLFVGWEQSPGTRDEVALAGDLGKPVYLPQEFDKLVDDWHKAKAVLCETEVVSLSAVSDPEPGCCFEHSCPHHDGFVQGTKGDWYDPRDPRELPR